MIEWRDQGILLSSRPHGESAAILEVFTPDHGRYFGVLQGGNSRKKAAMLQAGTQLHLEWRARLEGHIGRFTTVETLKSHADVMSNALTLEALNSLSALLRFALPERLPHLRLYHDTMHLIVTMNAAARGNAHWLPLYPQWELGLLTQMGFGLDLTQCAVTGATTDLAYISPRTGRSISKDAAGEWAPRLLAVSPGLIAALTAKTPSAEMALADVIAALRLTAYFLERALTQIGTHNPTAHNDSPLPEARHRLMRRLLTLNGQDEGAISLTNGAQ